MTTRFAVLAAVLLLLPVVVTGFGGAASAVTTVEEYDAGSEHGLADKEAVNTYEQEGVVTTQLSGIDARVTLAESHDDVGLDGIRSDVSHHYLRIQYNESIERTVRFELPAALFEPYPADGLESVNSDVTADLQPVRNGSATEVVVHFDGETDAVFKISKAASIVFGARDTTRGWIDRAAPFDVPSLTSSGSDWTRIPDSAWENGTSTPAIETTGEPLMIQYDASDTPGEERWVSVPDCGNERSYEDVCRFSREGSDAEFLVSRSNETPEVRYKHGRSLMDQGKAAMNELLESIQDLIDDFTEGMF